MPSVDAGSLLATATAPDENHPHLQLGFGHEADGRLRQAAASFRRAAALAPAHGEPWFCLTRLAYDAARPETAIACGRRSLACNPNGEADSLLGAALVASGRWREALPLFQAATRRRHGPEARPEPRTSFAKLAHDAEQIEHLVRTGRLAPAMVETATAYREILGKLPRDGNPAVVLEGEARRRLAPTYNHLLHCDPGAVLDGPALNPALDAKEIERAYVETRPQMAVVDNLLAPEALAAVLRFCQDSTVWFAGDYSGGYVGAQMGDGFAAPILFQIAEELKTLLPGVIGSAGLQHLWAFKYASDFSGIALHADAARVNVNFWITQDEANLDATSGGLEVFDVAAPAAWNFAAFNSDLAAIREHLDRTGSRSIVVPHRQNRAVIFNSDLFHRTGDIRFRDGYLNRRINVTMLYGTRQSDNPT
ncbi:MAG: hypothetical protein EXQ95_05305 [Alphaproteobacteria bacterium]|nr:hypothetical protein [Alphaproteobacteria bacterium]